MLQHLLHNRSCGLTVLYRLGFDREMLLSLLVDDADVLEKGKEGG